MLTCIYILCIHTNKPLLACLSVVCSLHTHAQCVNMVPLVFPRFSFSLCLSLPSSSSSPLHFFLNSPSSLVRLVRCLFPFSFFHFSFYFPASFSFHRFFSPLEYPLLLILLPSTTRSTLSLSPQSLPPNSCQQQHSFPLIHKHTLLPLISQFSLQHPHSRPSSHLLPAVLSTQHALYYSAPSSAIESHIEARSITPLSSVGSLYPAALRGGQVHIYIFVPGQNRQQGHSQLSSFTFTLSLLLCSAIATVLIFYPQITIGEKLSSESIGVYVKRCTCKWACLSK